MKARKFQDPDWHHFQRHAIADFKKVAFENPEKLALVSRCGTLSYHGLNKRANQLASHSNSLGIGLECVVAVALERGIEYIIAMLASWKVGATYLPLDQSLPAKRMQYMMSDSETLCLITVKRIIEEKSLILNAGTTMCLDDGELIDRLRRYPGTKIPSVAHHDNSAYIIYTSGTTGSPKGVVITHGSVYSLVDDIRQSREIEPSDRVLLFIAFLLRRFNTRHQRRTNARCFVVCPKGRRNLARQFSEDHCAAWYYQLRHHPLGSPDLHLEASTEVEDNNPCR